MGRVFILKEYHMVKKTYKITVKGLRASDRRSDETLCFEADIYVNGRKAGWAENDGKGGMTNWHFDDRKLEKDIAEWAKTQPKEDAGFEDNPGHPYMMDVTLESMIDKAAYAVYNAGVEARAKTKSAAAFRRKLSKVVAYRLVGKPYKEREYHAYTLSKEDPDGAVFVAGMARKYGRAGYVLITERSQAEGPQEALPTVA